MKVSVLFFASLREITGRKNQDISLQESGTVADLKLAVEELFPGFDRHLPNVVTAVNQEFALDDQILFEGDEVALFPPVSGGQDFPSIFAVQESEFDLNQVVSQITLPSTGAISIFTGIVRAVTEGGNIRDTQFLEYEAYQIMAESKMRQVAQEIRQKWPTVEGIAIIQRIGILYPGTPTVLIACSASHRDTGVFEASRYGIDRLKQIVPIWKKEVNPAGEIWVEGSYLPDQHD